MKSILCSLVTLLLVTPQLTFASASFSLIKANLAGSVSEVQKNTGVIATANLKEVSRSESSDTVVVYLMASQTQSSQYLAVLHEATDVNLTLDLNEMSPRGESSTIGASVQIQGDDDQFRKAEGYCLLGLDQSLECNLTPTFNAFGLLANTNLNLTLK